MQKLPKIVPFSRICHGKDQKGKVDKEGSNLSFRSPTFNHFTHGVLKQADLLITSLDMRNS